MSLTKITENLFIKPADVIYLRKLDDKKTEIFIRRHGSVDVDLDLAEVRSKLWPRDYFRDERIENLIQNKFKEIFPKIANKTIDIEGLNFSTRVRNALKYTGIDTMDSLLEKTPLDMLRLKNLGRQGLKSLLDSLEEIETLL